MATENKKLFIYVDGTPKSSDSQTAEIKFASIALKDKNGAWFEFKADVNVDGAISLSGVKFTDAASYNGRVVENDGAVLDSHVSGAAGYHHAISHVTGLQDALDGKLSTPTPITNGTFTKVSVDAHGLVTLGSDIQEADLPYISIPKVTGLETALANKIEKNGTITGATKTKITYDSKGLVTFGDDLSASDIPTISQNQVTGLEAAISDLSTFDANVGAATTGNGAALVGFADPSNQFTAATVEGALDEALDAAQAAQSTANAALPKAGGTMTGDIDLSGTHKVKNAAPGTAANDYVTKAQLDATGAGLDFQADVKNIQVDATLDPGATPVTGVRYIIKDAGALHANFGTIAGVGNNDIVQYNGSAFTVVFDASTHTGGGVLVWIEDLGQFQNYSGSVWAEFGGIAGVTAGTGLTKTGNTLNVLLGAGIKELPTDEIGIDLAANSGLELSDETAAGQLQVKLDGTSLAKGANGLSLGTGSAGAGMVLAAGALRSKNTIVSMIAAEALVAGDIVIASTTEAGKVLRADASAIASCEGVVGVVHTGGNADESVLIQVSGEVTVGNGGTGLTLGKRAFVSETIGQATSTAPSTALSVVYMLGVATASNKVILQPSLIIVN